MKKLVLGVLTFALVITACNKYDDDFKSLNDQIKALSDKVDGVMALQTNLSALASQITALQTAVSGLPSTAQFTTLSNNLTAVSGKVDAISTALNNLATTSATAASVAALKTQLDGIIASNATNQTALTNKLNDLQTKLNSAATSAEVASLKTDMLAAIVASANTSDAAMLAAINAAKADIQTAIAAGNTNVDTKLAALKTLVESANTATNNKINEVIADIAALSGDISTNQAATQLSINGLQLQLAAAQRDLSILLDAAAMYNGDVVITTDAEVDFYKTKLYQLAIINGNLTVNTDNISASKIDDVNLILNQVAAIIGTNLLGPGHWAYIKSSATDHLAAPNLTSIRGNYSVIGADIVDTRIDNVGGDLLYNYPGAYESTSLKTVGSDLKLVTQTGTLDINFPNVTIGGWVGDDAGAASGAVNFSALGTNSINFGLATGGLINNLTANNATSIKLGTIAYGPLGLTITAPVATTVNLAAATSSIGNITIATGTSPTTGTATLVDLSSLVTSGNLTVWAATAGNVKLDLFNSPVAVAIRGPESLTIPSWTGLAGSSLLASETKNLSLAKYRWLSVSAPGTIPSAANLLVLENLVLGDIRENVDLGLYNTTLKTASITGAATGDASHWATISALTGVYVPGVSTTGDSKLTSLTLGGLMNTVNVANLPKLTSVNTSGIINSFMLDNADLLTTLTLSHSNFEGVIGFGGPGSDLSITGNALLTTLTTTGLNKLQTLYIHDNPLLAVMNFNSYSATVNAIAAPIDIQIYNNNLSGTYTAALVQTGTQPYQEFTFTCPALLASGLKSYVHLYQVTYGSAGFNTLRIDVDHCPTTTTLAQQLYNNRLVSTIIPDGISNTTGISIDAELQQLQ